MEFPSLSFVILIEQCPFDLYCTLVALLILDPDVCVGTPRWMATEGLRAMHTPSVYGLVCRLAFHFFY